MSESGASPRWSYEPLHILGALAVGGSLMFAATRPILDLDIWWHRVIGAEVIRERRVSALGNSWAPFGDQDWVTTQWLSEVAFDRIHAIGGWDAVVNLRLIVAAVTLGLLTFTVLRRRPARAAVPVLCLAVIGISPVLAQDRPVVLTLPLLVVLAALAHNALEGRLPSPWLLAALALLWSNLHGSWILVPGAFGLVAAAQMMSSSTRPLVIPTVGRAAASFGAGLVTPLGLSGPLAIVRFRDRTDFIAEWAPVQPALAYAIPATLLIMMLSVAWARSAPVATPKIVYALAIVAFGWSANRNVVVATLLLAPLVAEELAARTHRGRVPTQREATLLRAAFWGILLGSLATAAFVQGRVDPLAAASPRLIAEALASSDGPTRVLNSYNASGVLLEFSRGNVELAIDGRADRYPSEYTAAYFAAVNSLSGWETLLEVTDPDVAVLHEREALSTHLQAQGWTVVQRDGDYLLLQPMGTGQ